jgi:hypothetical protein
MNIYLRVSSFVQKLLTVLLVIFTVGGFAQEKPDVSAPETAAERKFEKNQRRKLYSPAQFVHESSLFIKQPTKWKDGYAVRSTNHHFSARSTTLL